MARIIRRRTKGRTRRPKQVTKKGVKSAVRKYTNKVFNNRVKNAMASLMEVKEVQSRGNVAIVAFNGANAATADSTNIIAFDPVINQSAFENGRVGNVITMKNVMMRFMIVLNPASGIYGSVPQCVRLVWFYDRADVNSIPTPYTNANFIDNGASSTGMTGSLTDTFYRYNADRYRILGSRTYKLGFASATGLNADNTHQYYSNNDSKMFIKGTVNCTKWIIKKQKFNDNLGLAETRKLYCLVITVPQNGAVWPASQPSPCDFIYEIDFKYTDA